MLQELQYPAIKSSIQVISPTQSVVTFSPLMPGFGPTFGNSLRRLLLGSIPGFGVVSVRINSLTHEYQAVEGVKEDALDILLNIKSLRAKIITDDNEATITLKTNKKGDITAADFATNSAVEIVNKDLYICNISGDKEVEIEVVVARGFGYTRYEKRDLKGNTKPTALLIDTIFSPVRNVGLDVEQVRVGDKTNYDKVVLNMTTDGTIEAAELVDYALKLNAEIFSNMRSSLGAAEDVEAVTADNVEAKEADVMTAGDEIDLPKRVLRILEKNGVNTNSELKASADKVAEFDGMGAKSIEAVEEYIKSL